MRPLIGEPFGSFVWYTTSSPVWNPALLPTIILLAPELALSDPLLLTDTLTAPVLNVIGAGALYVTASPSVKLFVMLMALLLTSDAETEFAAAVAPARVS